MPRRFVGCFEQIISLTGNLIAEQGGRLGGWEVGWEVAAGGISSAGTTISFRAGTVMTTLPLEHSKASSSSSELQT